MSDNKRLAERYELPSLIAEVGGTECTLLNVSSTGVMLGDLPKDYATGDSLTVTIYVPFKQHVAPLKIHGTVVRTDGESVGVNYETPAVTWEKLLYVLSTLEN